MDINVTSARTGGQTITTHHFGGNTVYRANIDLETGLPTQVYQDAVEQLDLTHLRFPAGQTEAFFENGIIINNDIPASLRTFLNWARTADDGPYTVSIVLPTDRSFTNFADIERIAEIIIGEFSDVVTAFELGNEYWGPIEHDVSGETREIEYGRLASGMAEAISRAETRLSRDEEIDVLVQTANASGASSSYHFAKMKGLGYTERDRWDMANEDIATSLSQIAIDEIDGIIHHFYWANFNADDPSNNSGYRMDWHNRVWGQYLDEDFELHVTEWNIMASNRELLGMKSGGAIVQMFSDVLAAGTDHAQIWPPKHNTRNDLAGGNRVAVTYNDQQIVTNSIQGAVFDLMSSSLIGLAPLDLSVNGADTFRVPSTEVMLHAFGDGESAVFYLASTSVDTIDVTFDVGAIAGDLSFSHGIGVGIDQSSSDGVFSFEGQRSDEVERVVSRGETFFVNEDDVRAQISNIAGIVGADSVSITLKPYEVVELTFRYSNDNAGPDSPAVSESGPVWIQGTHNDEVFNPTNFARSVRGGSGFDTVLGGDRDDQLSGELGSDHIDGGGGHDLLDGGPGADTLIGGFGDDILVGGSQGDLLTGGLGKDIFRFHGADLGRVADRISDFQPGFDKVQLVDTNFGTVSDLRFSWNASEGGTVVILPHQDGSTSRILFSDVRPEDVQRSINFDFLAGSEVPEKHLLGSTGRDRLVGGASGDTIDGGAGDDHMVGGSGNDRITAMDGVDWVEAGTGSDFIVVSGTSQYSGNVFAYNASSRTQVGTGEMIGLEGLFRLENIIEGGSGSDTLQLSGRSEAFFLHDSFSKFHESASLSVDSSGNAGRARIGDIESIFALSGNDIIDLTSPDYSLLGQQILIDGGHGNDRIWGSDASERIVGGTGNDSIFGGTGGDTLVGGSGADTFEFTRTSSGTRVQDFDVLEGDKLRFFRENENDLLGGIDGIRIEDFGITVSYASVDVDILIDVDFRPHLGSMSEWIIFE